MENCLDIDVFWLKKHGYFCGYKYGGITWTFGTGEKSSIGFSVQTSGEPKFIEFKYTSTDRATDQKTDYKYKVTIVTTSCRFGGVRYWFLCPLSSGGLGGCNRRVGKLYLGGKYFGCRHCYNLTYDSRQSHNKRFEPLGRMLLYEKKSEELYSQIRRKYYGGKPTKKYDKFLRYCSWMNARGPALIQGLGRILRLK